MKKPMLIGLIAAIAALGLLFATIRSAQDVQKNTQPDLSALLNLPITIDGENFILSNGAAEKVSAPDSAVKNTVALVGEPVTGDVTGDGKPDAALLIRNDPGGSGTFYYAVVALSEAGSYRATNALLLGDRITPRAIDFTEGRFIYRFVERGAEEPMADTPTLERSVPVIFDPESRSIAAVGYFPGADWLWKPIGTNPALAADSATWVRYLSEADSEHVAELYREGTTLVPSTAVIGSTPRYDITFTQPWGSDPFGDHRVPIPRRTHVPQYEGGDGHLAIQDPDTGQVFGLWQANYDAVANNWTAAWGGMTPIDGDGVDTSGSATATNLSRYAGVVTAAEMTAAISRRQRAEPRTGLRHRYRRSGFRGSGHQVRRHQCRGGREPDPGGLPRATRPDDRHRHHPGYHRGGEGHRQNPADPRRLCDRQGFGPNGIRLRGRPRFQRFQPGHGVDRCRARVGLLRHGPDSLGPAAGAGGLTQPSCAAKN